jgi:YD repeat-containing protein
MRFSTSGHTRGLAAAGLILAGLLAETASGQTTLLPPAEHPNPYFTVRTFVNTDGTILNEMVINGPPVPPPGYDLQRSAVALPAPDQEMGINTLAVPAYQWSFGCSATSAAMIAAYYDRNGYPNMYTGPTNSGVMPLDGSPWPSWVDAHGFRQFECPLTASHNGLDGRSSRGSLDDYWITYESTADDPYITNGWTQHTYGAAIGDYMGTSQSTWPVVDGATAFYYSPSSSPMPCSSIPKNDGTTGRRAFYEAKGYTVTDCYAQETDNQYAGGFSFAQFEAEIDAGRPVMVNLAGHTVVGIGYDSSSNTIYIHDTWDYKTHTMTWGGSYAGMAMQSVSIVNLAVAAGAKFYPVTPCRVVDTRSTIDPQEAKRGNFLDDEVRAYTLSESSDCPGLPTTATAWSLNIQLRPISQATYLIAFPDGITQPAVSSLVASPDRWRVNNAIVPAGAGGAFDVSCQFACRVVIDVNGYFAP